MFLHSPDYSPHTTEMMLEGQQRIQTEADDMLSAPVSIACPLIGRHVSSLCLSLLWSVVLSSLLIGLTHSTTNRHVCRAVLESSAYHTTTILSAMQHDSHIPLTSLRVDGGLAASDLLLQHQADLLNIPVIRPSMLECTAAGAAYAAGLADGVGIWKNTSALIQAVTADNSDDTVFTSKMENDERIRLMHGWDKAVQRSLGWIDSEEKEEETIRKNRRRKKSTESVSASTSASGKQHSGVTHSKQVKSVPQSKL